MAAMDVLKAQLEKIKEQLAGLTATQRMLVATLVGVMILTLLYWGHYAGNAEMTPLLDQALSSVEIGKISQALDLKGVPHTVVGDKIMVPTDRKMELVADLMYQNALPMDLHSVFDEVNKNLNPFSSPTEREATYNQAREMMLSQIISRFPNVGDAQVMINAKNEQRVEESMHPSASIIIKLRDPVENPKPLVIAAADAVAHAVSGLTRGRIGVIVDGRSIPLTDPENDPLSTGNDLMLMKIKAEAMESQRIYATFSYIEGLLVAVSVQIDNQTTSRQTHTYDKDNTLSKPVKEMSETEESNAAPAAAAEPGVGANTGASLASSGASGAQNTTTNKESTENQILPSDKTESTQIPAGKITVQSATMRIPHSYFLKMYKDMNPKAKDPDEAAIQTVMTAELAKIKAGLKTTTGLKSDDDISVDTYPDIAVTGTMAMATIASPVASSMTTVTAYGKQIAVGVLAVVSLFMMSSMVRKATPAPVVAIPIAVATPSILSAAESLAGEVGMTNATLDGMELDEDAVKNQQMIDQVSTMVKENPDGAAALVKRWLNRS
jgi:flagellar biosynthesis/type III secretory pathway M-ring protein FliF/YscJ